MNGTLQDISDTTPVTAMYKIMIDSYLTMFIF